MCKIMFSIEVKVGLKKGVSDPEGANTHKSLELLGYDGVRSVKSLKMYRIDLEASSKEEAEKMVEEMCIKVLTNPVIHTHEISIL